LHLFIKKNRLYCFLSIIFLIVTLLLNGTYVDLTILREIHYQSLRHIHGSSNRRVSIALIILLSFGVVTGLLWVDLADSYFLKIDVLIGSIREQPQPQTRTQQWKFPNSNVRHQSPQKISSLTVDFVGWSTKPYW
jgi:hypothetical protein